MKWLYTAADVILWCPETPLSRLNFKKFKLVGVSFGDCVCNLGLVGNISADTRILKDFSPHISIRSQFYLGELYKKNSFWGSLCLLFIFFTVHLSFWQLSVAISVLQFIHVCFSNCRYDHGGYALDSQSLSETKSRGSGVRMNWKTLSEVKNENLGHGEKVHTNIHRIQNTYIFIHICI